MFDFTVGDKVSYLTLNDKTDTETYEHLGTVTGFGTNNGVPVVLVALYNPFWSEGRQHFVGTLAVHHSNLRITDI